MATSVKLVEAVDTSDPELPEHRRHGIGTGEVPRVDLAIERPSSCGPP
jgi:hypothetical protein